MPSGRLRGLTVVLIILLGAVALATLFWSPQVGIDEYEGSVSVTAPNGSVRGDVAVAVADSPVERYNGLSNTESLSENEGMLFVFAEERKVAFVMRDMNYPLDMVFVGADGRINEVHHAPVENDDDLTRYTGQARWVLEVPYGWTTEHDVSEGDRVVIEVGNETNP